MGIPRADGISREPTADAFVYAQNESRTRRIAEENIQLQIDRNHNQKSIILIKS